MKIECDICQTVFLIDDNLISDKGIKAQCPRCGDQKVVRRPPADDFLSEPAPQDAGGIGPLFTGDSAAFAPHQFTSDTPVFGGDSLSGGFGAAGGSATYVQDSNYGQGGGDFGFIGSSDDISADLTCFKCGKPIPESTDSVLPVCDNCRGETANYSPMDMGGNDLPTTAGASGPAGYDYGASPPPEAAYSPFGSNGSSTSLNASPDFIPSSSLPPSTDNAPTFMPVDRDLDGGGGFDGGYDGGYDDGYGNQGGMLPLGDVPLGDGDGKLDPSWIKVRRISDGQEVGPISLAEVRSLYVHGKLSMDDEYSGHDGIWYPIHQVPELMVILRRTPQLGSGQTTTTSGGGGQGILLWLVAILLLGGGGATAWLIWANSQKAGNGKANTRDSARKIPPDKLLTEKISQWKRQYPGVKTGAKESKRLTKEGLKVMRGDTKANYTQGIAFFAKALIAQRGNRNALAGYCLATVWSPDPKQSSERRKGECASLLKQKAKKGAPPLTRAVYSLYLMRRGANATARRYARLASKRAKKDPYVQLLYGALLHSQQKQAKRQKRVLALSVKNDKSMARAHWLLAKMDLKGQHYANAEGHLKSLEASVHPKGLFLYATFHIAMGQFKQAADKLQKLLEKNPNHVRAWLKLGIIQYQLLDQKKSALKLLTTIPTLGPGRTLKPIFVRKRLLHLGYIALRNNDLKAAETHAQALKPLLARNTDVQFFQVQYLAAQKKYKEASTMMQKLLARLSSPAYKTYASILKARAGQLDAAIGELRALSRENTNYIWPRLALPAMLCKQKKNGAALLEFKKVISIEPDALKYKRKPTDYYFVPRGWLKLRSDFLRTKATREERAIFKAAAGLVAYHAGRRSEATGYLRSARNIDRNGLISNLYLGQIYYERGRNGQATSYAKRVYTNYEENPTAALILANIAKNRKQYSKALKLYRTVKRERPWFLSAKLGLAMLLIKKKNKKEAKAILDRLLLSQHKHHWMAITLYKLKH